MMAVRKPALAFGGLPSVNLLPVVETERRERVSLTRRWIWAAVGAVVVTALIIGGVYALNLLVGQQLTAQQAESDALLLERAEYSDVSQAIASTNSLQSFRAEAMARDFAWGPLAAEVSSRLPEGVTIVEIALAPTADPVIAAGFPADTVGASGTFTFTATDTRAQADTVARLRDLPGLIGVDAGSLFASGDNGVEFTVAVIYDTTIYTGDYAVEGKN